MARECNTLNVQLIQNEQLGIDLESNHELGVSLHGVTIVSAEQIHSDTTARWNANPQFIGKKDHIYVYTDYTSEDGISVAGIKVGDGTSYLIDMPFVAGNQDMLADHINDQIVHITQAERSFWNSKVTCFISGADPATLVFTTAEGE